GTGRERTSLDCARGSVVFSAATCWRRIHSRERSSRAESPVGVRPNGVSLQATTRDYEVTRWQSFGHMRHSPGAGGVPGGDDVTPARTAFSMVQLGPGKIRALRNLPLRKP